MTFTSNQALVTVAVLIGLAVFGPPPAAHAKLTPAQKCASAKLKAAAKKADNKVKCHAKTNLAAAPDPTCLQKAEDKFTTAFTNAEKPAACKENGDAVDIEATVDTFVDAVVAALQPPAGALKATQKCAVTKIKAASKKAVAKTTCQTKNLSLPNAGILAICYGFAEDKFDTAFAKAETPGACATAGDAADVEARVDTFVGDIAQALIPPTPTPIPPTPVPTPPCSSGFVDLGDGTIFDCGTKLMWEKKDFSNTPLNDYTRTRAWAGICSIGGAPCQPNYATSAALCNAQTGGAPGCALCGAGACSEGYTMWSQLVDLNAVNFAGHNDWRIPTVAELQTIVASSCPGFGQPCVALAFNNGCTPGCTVTTCSCSFAFSYWSASTYAPDPSSAWSVNFFNGSSNTFDKEGSDCVRAVRGGS